MLSSQVMLFQTSSMAIQKTLIKHPQLQNSLFKHKLHGLLYCKHRLSSLIWSTNPYHASTKALPGYNGLISESNIGSSSPTSSSSSSKHVMASRPWNRDICSQSTSCRLLTVKLSIAFQHVCNERRSEVLSEFNHELYRLTIILMV